MPKTRRAKKRTSQLLDSVYAASADDYASKVIGGGLEAGPHVRAACKRHLADHGCKRFHWNEASAQHAVQWIEQHCNLWKGVGEGEPLRLLGWQRFVVESLFGWQWASGESKGGLRFRRATIFTGKGSGKTPLAAAICLYRLLGEWQQRQDNCPEIYIIARNSDQAGVPMRACVEFRKGNASLTKTTKVIGGVYPTGIASLTDQGGFIKRLASQKEGEGKSGYSPSMVLAEELHEHRDEAMLFRMAAGVKDRPNPLVLIITNSGPGEHHFSWRIQERAIKAARGGKGCDAEFGYICAMDKGDDFVNDERLWSKANPSLPLIPGLPYVRDEIAKSKVSASARAELMRYVFCQWIDTAADWLDLELWNACERAELSPAAERAEVPCYAGVDLSETSDFTAGVLCWKFEDRLEVEATIWVPNMSRRNLAERAIVMDWKAAAQVEVIDGARMDYKRVAEWAIEASKQWRLRAIAYDRYKWTSLRDAIEAGGVPCRGIQSGEVVGQEESKESIRVVAHGQGQYSPTPKEQRGSITVAMPRSVRHVEKVVEEGKLRVKQCGPLREAVLGAICRVDRQNNKYLDKGPSGRRIDAAVAMVMAVGLAEEWPETDGGMVGVADIYSDDFWNSE